MRHQNVPGVNRFWHGQSMAPWLFDGAAFISYDDAESLAKKANFVWDQALGGVMIWEISLDPNQYLLDALLQGLQPEQDIAGISEEGIDDVFF